MKNVTRLMLGIVAIFAVVLLVACGAKSDNGTYKMETNIDQLMGQYSESEVLKDAKVTIELTIKDSKGELKIIQKMAGNEVPIKLDLKVDQKEKSLKRSYGDMELKYNIKGVMTPIFNIESANCIKTKASEVKRVTNDDTPICSYSRCEYSCNLA